MDKSALTTAAGPTLTGSPAQKNPALHRSLVFTQPGSKAAAFAKDTISSEIASHQHPPRLDHLNPATSA
jgi:hypothetical protein